MEVLGVPRERVLNILRLTRSTLSDEARWCAWELFQPGQHGAERFCVSGAAMLASGAVVREAPAWGSYLDVDARDGRAHRAAMHAMAEAARALGLRIPAREEQPSHEDLLPVYINNYLGYKDTIKMVDKAIETLEAAA